MVAKQPAHRPERAVGVLGSLSGFTSILGSWQVCHSICLGLVALLAIIGITVTGMPLLFLTKIAIPLWLLALALLAVAFLFYVKKRCIPRNMLLLNSGLLIAGTPFAAVQRYAVGFWVVGGVVAIIAIFLMVRNKLRRRT